MRTRIFAESSGPETRRGDVLLFAMAVRQVRRFADLIRDAGPTSHREAMAEAIATFDSTSPHAKGIRDIFDHFDAYLKGTGHAYRAKSPNEYYYEGHVSTRTPINMWVEPIEGEYRLHIQPTPETHLVLDVNREARASTALAAAITDVLRRR